MVDSQKRKKKRLDAKKRSREPLPLDQLEDWKREVETGSDRAVAIIAVSNLEAILSEFIMEHLTNNYL